MTAQDLKNSILQLAVQGKLVPQDPNDEPASELLKRCSTTFLKVSDEYVFPFDIPNSWEWTKLGNLVSVIGGTSYKSNEVTKSGVRILRGGNIQNSEVLYLDNDVFLPESFIDSEKTIRNGDVLIVASTGSKAVIGKPGFVFEDDAMTQIGAFLRIIRPHHLVLAPFIRTLFDSEYYRGYIRNQVQGMNINNVKNEHITEFIVPIPPLAEQERIVARIEELLPLINEYDEAEKRLTSLNAEFPDKLRKSILQQAVQGKLTERDPADDPASELLKRIQAEKAKLIAEGKIKKEKTLPPIMDEEKPFDIPDTWVWAPMGVIYNIHSSKRIHAKEYTSEGIPFFRSLEVVSLAKGVDPSVSFYISKTRYDEICQDNIMPKNGDLLIACIGGSIGRNWVVDNRIFYYKDGNVVAFDGHSDFNIEYLRLYLSSPAFLQQIFDDVSGTAYKALTIGMLKGHYIPVPPLAEQKRIVERVNELLAVCDGLND